MALFIVATPIGNLQDISQRAIETLKSVALILCEDTRVTRKLLDAYAITTPTMSYHHHSTLGKMEKISGILKEDKDVALVSDAGTPGISDPGNLLIDYLLKEIPAIEILPIPGPSAVISALSISGFPTDHFTFYGFMPHKKGKETLVKKIIESDVTSVFYESPHRILKTLEKFKALGLTKQVMVCRELSKKFETTYRGGVGDVMEAIEGKPVKGEFVVVISGKEEGIQR